jgi:putative hydrolase
VDAYLRSVDLDARKLLETFRRALDEARRAGGWRELGILFLLMTPEQRSTFRRMQAVMSLLEGHGNYVMDALAPGRVREAERMRRVLQERRRALMGERVLQRAIGFEAKLRQYDLGERFVASVVRQAGMERFNRIWEREENLPTLHEVRRPDAWVERVARA